MEQIDAVDRINASKSMQKGQSLSLRIRMLRVRVPAGAPDVAVGILEKPKYGGITAAFALRYRNWLFVSLFPGLAHTHRGKSHNTLGERQVLL